MLLLCFYVPEKNKEEVKKAVFEAGGGSIGNYDSCSFETMGMGQFRALQGSKPHIGKLDQVEKVPEVKVELVCEEARLPNIIKALKDSHPYETPAYYIIRMLN
jgi:hypothetical protein